MHFPDNMIVTSFYAFSHDYEKTQPIHVGKGHVHTLTFRTSGTKVITPNGTDNARTLVSEKGSITYLPKGVSYDSDTILGGHMYSVHFELDSEKASAEPFVFTPGIAASPITFENLFRTLCDNFRIASPDTYTCLSVLYEIFGLIKRETEAVSKVAVPKRMRLAKEYIDKNFGSPGLAISHLAAASGISEVYFRREFRACFGASPIEYIKSVRLENAKALLGTGLYSVSEVATRCGFDSISYFSSEFGRLCGMTPTEYAKTKG